MSTTVERNQSVAVVRRPAPVNRAPAMPPPDDTADEVGVPGNRGVCCVCWEWVSECRCACDSKAE